MPIIKHARTARLIAAELGVSVARVRHILKTRPDIQPIGVAGATKIYDSTATARVRYELSKIDARRHGGRDDA